MDERVAVEIVEHVAVVRLARPAKHNALDLAMFRALRDAATTLAGEPAVRAVVLHGEGPSFCSGLDVRAASAGELDPAVLLDRPAGEAANLAQSVAFGWRELPVPVIAAVHGACFGGGLQIALGADVRIAAPDARLSVMEITLGLIPDMALTVTLPPLVRLDVAKELTWTGRVVDGHEAQRLGLVTRVDADPLAAARALAGEIAARSPQAIRAAKALLHAAWDAPPAESLRLETEHVRGLFDTAGSPLP